jgi:hypothetical protein
LCSTTVVLSTAITLLRARADQVCVGRADALRRVEPVGDRPRAAPVRDHSSRSARSARSGRGARHRAHRVAVEEDRAGGRRLELGGERRERVVGIERDAVVAGQRRLMPPPGRRIDAVVVERGSLADQPQPTSRITPASVALGGRAEPAPAGRCTAARRAARRGALALDRHGLVRGHDQHRAARAVGAAVATARRVVARRSKVAALHEEAGAFAPPDHDPLREPAAMPTGRAESRQQLLVPEHHRCLRLVTSTMPPTPDGNAVVAAVLPGRAPCRRADAITLKPARTSTHH